MHDVQPFLQTEAEARRTASWRRRTNVRTTFYRPRIRPTREGVAK